MAAIDKYDSDIILDRALTKLHEECKAGFPAPQNCRLELIILMNYLDTIAVGIKKKLYDEDLVKSFMESIINEHMKEIIDGKLLAMSGGNPSDFDHICELRTSWRAKCRRAVPAFDERPG